MTSSSSRNIVPINKNSLVRYKERKKKNIPGSSDKSLGPCSLFVCRPSPPVACRHCRHQWCRGGRWCHIVVVLEWERNCRRQTRAFDVARVVRVVYIYIYLCHINACVFSSLFLFLSYLSFPPLGILMPKRRHMSFGPQVSFFFSLFLIIFN